MSVYLNFVNTTINPKLQLQFQARSDTRHRHSGISHFVDSRPAVAQDVEEEVKKGHLRHVLTSLSTSVSATLSASRQPTAGDRRISEQADATLRNLCVLRDGRATTLCESTPHSTNRPPDSHRYHSFIVVNLRVENWSIV